MAVAYAESRNFEREAVVEERHLLRDALKLAMGEVSLADLRGEMDRRLDAGEFLASQASPDGPGRAFTTQEMIHLEQETITIMHAGLHTRGPVSAIAEAEVQRQYPHLNKDQRTAVVQILGSDDRFVALEGVAGSGKTTALTAIRTEAERRGYRVEGLAPTSRAAQLLAESGMSSNTLQRHLATPEAARPDGRCLYVLDESSLASTRQMHMFLTTLRQDDRVLLVGDVRQHQGVEAGRPYQQLQEAGLQTARLDTIVRQRDPGLNAVVVMLARGDIGPAIRQLDVDRRVHEIVGRHDRLQAVAHEYTRSATRTLVVAPDNASRIDLNAAIHRAQQDTRQVDRTEHRLTVLIARQDVAGSDRFWARHYQVGDVIRYTRGSRALGLPAGTYARVAQVQADENQLTVRLNDGKKVTYDPQRLSGVTLYREAERAFSVGDRIQFTAPNRPRHLANRELGTIERMDARGHLQIRLDSGRTTRFRIGEHPHLDYGYAVTSYSSQGQTADRVLIYIDTAHASEQLINSRLAYVAVSRARYDVQI
jgi:ATP-dependent exoDNAse (exonuclease V) alpha subunit